MVRFLFRRIVASENDSAQMGITCQARAIGAIAQERNNRWIAGCASKNLGSRRTERQGRTEITYTSSYFDCSE